MRESLRLVKKFLVVNIQQEMQYRANFFVQLVNSTIALAVGIITVRLVFSHTGSLGGWEQSELMVVLGIHILLGGVIKAFIEPNMTDAIRAVREGSLDYTIVRPHDTQLLTSINQTQVWNTVDVVIGLGVIGYAVTGIREALGWWQVSAFAVTLLLGAWIIYCLWIVITTLAFKVMRVDPVITMFQGIYQAGRWPVSIYPTWLRTSLTALVPLAFAITIPAEALVNRLTPSGLAGTILFTIWATLVSRYVWNRGLRSYSGASA